MHRIWIAVATLVCLAVFAAAVDEDWVEGPRNVARTTAAQVGFSADSYVERMPELRKQVARSLGLDPLPARTPLNVKRFGVLVAPDFVIERLEYDSAPGFPVTANLYLPKNADGPVPAVINLHGHWPGAKRSEQVRMRCAQMARMGIAALAIDTYGSPGDGNERGHLGGHWDNAKLGDGPASHLFATGVTPAAISVWDAVRAVDLLEQRPEVNPERILTCGASFGATNALMAAAVDTRIHGAIAVCYGSSYTHFPSNNSGELVPGIRENAEAHELIALVAPRRLFLLQHYHEQPFVAQSIHMVYDALGAKDAFDYRVLVGRHDFDKEKREAVYQWLAARVLKRQAEVKENPAFPFPVDSLFCHADHRVDGGAVSVTDLFDRVEEAAGSHAPDRPGGTDWPRRRDTFRARLNYELGYAKTTPGGERRVFGVVSLKGGEELPAGDLRWQPFASGSGAVCLAPPGLTTEGRVRVMPENTPASQASAWLHRMQGEGTAACAVRLDGVERAHQAVHRDWSLEDLTDAQVRFGVNVLSIVDGDPVIFLKIRGIARAAAALTAFHHVPADRVVLQASGTDANVVLTGAVLDGRLDGPLELTAPLLTYKRNGEFFAPVHATPPKILTLADVPDLVALLAPRPVTIAGGTLPGGAKHPDPGAAMAGALATYEARKAKGKLVLR